MQAGIQNEKRQSIKESHIRKNAKLHPLEEYKLTPTPRDGKEDHVFLFAEKNVSFFKGG